MSGRDLGASSASVCSINRERRGGPSRNLLQYFAMERFLYRLAKSRFADQFVLKEALLLTAWRAPLSRPTMDIDLAGRTSNELAHIRSLIGEVCGEAAEPDGIEFHAAMMQVARITEHAGCEGVRVRFHATLARRESRCRSILVSAMRLFQLRPKFSTRRS